MKIRPRRRLSGQPGLGDGGLPAARPVRAWTPGAQRPHESLDDRLDRATRIATRHVESPRPSGAFTLDEAATDVLALADALSWARFAVVGHSMSALVALHLAQHHGDRVSHVVALTPPPPTGFGADDATFAALCAAALADDASRLAFLEQWFGARLSPGWAAYKASRWRASADPVAAAGYVSMFARGGLSDPTARITVPVLALTGEEDAPPMRSESVTRLLSALCERLLVTPLAESGHYPMQEMPPLTVALVTAFLAG